MSDFQNTSGKTLEENSGTSGPSYKPFQIISPVLISISHGNTIETSLTSRKCRLAKFCKLDAWSQGILFTEKEIFLVDFSLIPEIFAHIQNPTKY